MPFAESWENLLIREGGYSDDPDDSGGHTKYGITVSVARANGYAGEMRDLDEATARSIAKSQYWDAMRLDAVDVLSPLIADRLLDIGYNTGIDRAGRFLQRLLNALNNRATLYDDIDVDGAIGPRTITALQTFLAHRGRDGVLVMRRGLQSLLGAYYIALAEAREKDEKFLYGWLLQRLWLS